MMRLTKVFIFLLSIIFTGNAFAAGYSCPTYLKYTSCAIGYYMTASSSTTACAATPAVGNACRPCSVYGVGFTCSGGTVCPALATYTVTLDRVGGTGGDTSLMLSYNDQMPQISLPTRAGYVFDGYMDENDRWIYDSDGNPVISYWDIPYNTTLYAQWSLPQIVCSAGQYLPANATSCSTCTAGSYCPGGTFYQNTSVQGLTACPTNYTNGGTGLSTQNQCKFQTTAGNYIATANATSQTTCSVGYYCPAALVNYGNTGTRTPCPTNYTSGGTGLSLQNQCKLQTTAGSYIATANAISQTTCPAGSYCASTLVSYGSTGGATACPTNYVNGGNGLSAQNQCKWQTTAGQYIATANATTATTCPAGSYCASTLVSYGSTGGSTACPTNYVNGGSGLSAQNQCKWQTTAGQYIATANATTATTCPAGSYCPVASISYGSTGSITQCTGATYSADGAGSCSSCPSGYTANTTAGKTAATQCQIQINPGYYLVTVNSSTQSNCPSGYYCPGMLLNYGATGGTASCPTNYISGGTGLSAQSQCKFQTTAGYWIGTANSSTQSVCTSGYYCPAALINYGSIGTRTACPTNYTNGGTGLGAQNQCKLQTSSGRYVANAFDTATITCPVGFYCPAALVAYGDTGSTVTCPTGYDDGGSGLSTQTQCRIQTTAGNYIATANSDEQTLCLSGYYCPAALIYYGNTGTLTACPTNYDDGGAGLSAQNQCKFQTDPGYSIINANSTTQTICASGYYCPAELINYGSTGSRLSCPTNYTNGGTGLYAQNQCKFQTVGGRYIKNAGDTSQNICPAGSYCVATLVAYGNTGSIEQCTGTTYSLSNASSCSECPTNYIADTTNGKTAVSQCKIQTTAGNYIATANATTETMCLGGYYCPATLVGYGTTGSMTQCTGTTYAPPGSSSCSACPTGYESNSTAGKSSESQCQLLTTAGKYIDTANSATQVTCLAGSYCPAAMINYGSIGSITQCTGALFSGPGQGSCTGCPSGYTANTDPGKTLASQCQLQTTAGRFISTANGTAQTDCTAGYYCPEALVNYGSTGLRLQCTGQTYSSSRQSECTACPSEYDDNPADGKTGVTQCQIRTTAGNWISTTQATEQTSCTVGYYCAGSVMVGYSQTGGRTACPTNYDDAPAGASTEGQCARQTSPGYYISIAYSISEAACLSGYYCPSELVYYGNIGSLNACPAGYVNGGTWVPSQDKCKLQTTSGKYIDTPYSNTQITCPAGYYCPGTLVEYGSTGSITQCTGATYSGAGAANCNNCPSAYSDNIDPGKTATTECQADLTPGYYLSGSTEVTCTAGSYCPGGMINYGGTAGRTNCPTNYTAGGTGLSAQNQCKILTTDGNYIATANASTQTPCISGHYCPSTLVNYGDTGSMIACLAGTYAPESSSSCTNCVIGSYSGNASSVCTACQNGTTTSVDGSASCDATCSNNDGYDSSWNSAIWNSNNTVSNSCSISGCAGGYYIATDSCTAVGSGYWSADGSATRTSCSVGLTTVGYGSGADEVGDCGRILKAGTDQIYLRSAKKTTPSLGVKVNGTTYYGNMTTEAKGNLKVKSSGTQYSVYDESM